MQLSPGAIHSPSAVRPGLRATIGFVAVVAVTLSLLPLKRWLHDAAPAWPGARLLDVEFTYQALTLAMTAVLIVGLRKLGSPARYLAIGDIAAPAEALPLLGVKKGESWRVVLRNFAIIATSVTAIVVYLQIARDASNLTPHLLTAFLLSLPFSAANAAVEEGILRVALLESTVDVLGASRAALLSGALFGAVHYFGMPGGLPGVAMAGFLGFVVARSVIETRGAFGAWLIHFLQDVVIFTLLFAVTFARDAG